MNTETTLNPHVAVDAWGPEHDEPIGYELTWEAWSALTPSSLVLCLDCDQVMAEVEDAAHPCALAGAAAS